MSRTKDQLVERLKQLDGNGYPQYKSVKGLYDYGQMSFRIDHIQGDPFAQPSRVAFLLSRSQHGFGAELYSTKPRRVALCDAIARSFDKSARKFSKIRGSGKGGIIEIDAPKQEILERTACQINESGDLELRFYVGFPAHGRRIAGEDAAAILGSEIVSAAEASLFANAHDLSYLERYTKYNEDADWLREQLDKRGLVAFVADGSLLPRQSGIDDRPLQHGAVSFKSPPAFAVEFSCPNGNELRGMGIFKGVTLIVGGGFHGKSTLLDAVKRGVYNHVLGDGREWVITDENAIKIRAEDGRSVSGVNISPFIDNLPQNKPTLHFSTQNASGSTSQAAAIVEGIEAGASTLLIDEDTSATNFMIRDNRMQKLIAKDREPITPFVDRVRQLYQDLSISTVLVMGGSGDYFDHADRVIAMNAYVAEDVTAKALEIAKSNDNGRTLEGVTTLIPSKRKIDLGKSSRGFEDRGRIKIRVRGTDELSIGSSQFNCSHVEQIVDSSQLRAAGYAIASWHKSGETKDLDELVSEMFEIIETQGLDGLCEQKLGDLACFRRADVFQIISRMRELVSVS